MAREHSETKQNLISTRKRARSALPTLGSRIFLATVVVTLVSLVAAWLGVDQRLREFAVRSNEVRLRDARRSLESFLQLHHEIQLREARMLAARQATSQIFAMPDEARMAETSRLAAEALRKHSTQDLILLVDARNRFVAASKDWAPRHLRPNSSIGIRAGSGPEMQAIAHVNGQLALITRSPIDASGARLGSLLAMRFISLELANQISAAVGTDVAIVDDHRVVARAGSLAERELEPYEIAGLVSVCDKSCVHRIRLAGIEAFAVAKPIAYSSRFVLIQSTEAMALLFQSLHNWLLPALLVIILATMIISRIMSKRLADPIAGLARLADKVAAGQLDAAVPTNARTAELARLEDAFGEMTLRLRTLLEDVQDKNATLASQRDELARANRAKSNFLATASHELRTPISSIRSFSEILLAGDADDEPEETRIEFLGIIQGESERLSRLVEQLLDLATIESGIASWSNEDVDLGEIVTTTLKALEGLGQANSVLFKFTRAKAELPYRGDRDRLQQTFTNLVGNAVKFSPEGSTVEVSIKRDTFGYIIHVDDEGPGVPEAKRGRIFEKFVQSDDVLTDKPQGSGLGLAIVREIVQVHGGRVRCDRAPSGGARFVVRLPEPHALRPLERFVSAADAAAQAAEEVAAQVVDSAAETDDSSSET